MREDWRVLVVEDDPTVAKVHCGLVGQTRGFAVVAVAATAGEASRMVADLHPDLVLLDLGLPGESGLTLLRRLRARAAPVEVIAVTAASSTDVIRAALHLGVLDYLIKPFRLERLVQALGVFRHHMAALQPRTLEQPGVDAVHRRARWLPKDIAEDRLEQVRQALAAATESRTAEEIGREVHASRVTARRYLEYLATVGEVTVTSDVHGPGRPRKSYLARGSATVDDARRARAGGAM
jgi:response regulator of citrate/malate metabolism